MRSVDFKSGSQLILHTFLTAKESVTNGQTDEAVNGEALVEDADAGTSDDKDKDLDCCEYFGYVL
jgi:hypothetical protein